MLQDSVHHTPKILTVDDLPALSPDGGKVCDALANILTDFLEKERDGGIIEIPSMISLANFYGCTHMDVYDALRALKSRGYEYHIRGIDNPVRLGLE